MFKHLNRGISTPIAITIIVVLAVFVVGGILGYQYCLLSKDKIKMPEVQVETKKELFTTDFVSPLCDCVEGLDCWEEFRKVGTMKGISCPLRIREDIINYVLFDEGGIFKIFDENKNLLQEIKFPFLANFDYPYHFEITDDINFDGYNDIAITLNTGMILANFNVEFWIYNPSLCKFEKNEDLGVLISPQFLKEEKKIISTSRSQAGLSYSINIFTFKDGKYSLTEREGQYPDRFGDIFRTREKLIDGKWQVVEKGKVGSIYKEENPEVANWKTYERENPKFRIKYPEYLVVSETIDSNGDSIIRFEKKHDVNESDVQISDILMTITISAIKEEDIPSPYRYLTDEALELMLRNKFSPLKENESIEKIKIGIRQITGFLVNKYKEVGVISLVPRVYVRITDRLIMFEGLIPTISTEISYDEAERIFNLMISTFNTP